MNFGLAQRVCIVDFESQKTSTLIARPSAWHKAAVWVEKNLDGVEDVLKPVYNTYAWGYYGIFCAGRLKEFGLPDKLKVEDIEKMMDRFAITIEEVKQEGDAFPLA